MERREQFDSRILVIDARVPTPDRDAGSQRIFQLLKLLRSLSPRVAFAPDEPSPPDRYSQQLQAEGIETLIPDSSPDSLAAHLRQYGARYDVVWVSRVDVAEKHFPDIRRYAPQAVLLFDTVDLHFLRQYRMARLTGYLPDLKEALRRKAQEVEIAERADCTLVVSDSERAALRQACPGLKVEVVSYPHEVFGCARPFERREHILFAGGFEHAPNADAVRYFLRDILPPVRREIPEAKFFIVGSDPPPSVRRAAAATGGVSVTGYVKDLTPYFDGCKLSVAPLRFGAGIKGKVLSSLSRGVPVVASSIAAEGLPLAHGKEALIADRPQDFSRAVINLYRKRDLWQQLSDNGLQIISQYYAPAIVRSQLAALFAAMLQTSTSSPAEMSS